MKRIIVLLVMVLMCGCRYAGNMQIRVSNCQNVKIELKDTEQTTDQKAGKEVMRGAKSDLGLK